MLQLWWSRFLIFLTAAFAPALAYAAQAAPEAAGRGGGRDWGWLWIALVVILMIGLFSVSRTRRSPPFERPRM